MGLDKKAVILAIGISLVLLSLIGNIGSNVTKANPLPPSWMNPQMTVTIESPANGSANSLPVLVNFTAQCTWQFLLGQTFPNDPSQDWIREFYYVIDNQNMSSQGINFTQIQRVNVSDPIYYFNYFGQAYLSNLTEGSHTVTIYWGVLVNVGTPSQFIVYNSTWSATAQFYVDSTISPSSTPAQTPSPIWLTIDLADHNYLNNVPVGQPVYFSAVVSNGVPPYRYEWKYRPYYVGTTIGDMHPTGDWIEGPTTNNFTLTANLTGSYLIEVKVWDSAGAQGMFMSLPPGIWVNAKSSTSIPSPNSNPTSIPSHSPSPTPSPTPSSSPTQQATMEPSPTLAVEPPYGVQFVSYAEQGIIVGSVIAVVVSLIVYFRKRRG
jgi:hypothetical protein